MSEVLSLNSPLLESGQSPSIERDGRAGRKGQCYLSSLLTLGSWSLDEKRPVLTRRSLSIRRQSANLEKATPSTSYFNLPTVSTEGTTPPPPYFSPPKDEVNDSGKAWIDLLERQNKELMEQITVLSSQANPSPPALKPRPMSFHGGPSTTKEPPSHDLQATLSSNVLIQKQIATMQEELLRTRRRCAELSEVEARKRGLELRCLGLERVVEELMSAIDLMKNHPPPPRATFDEHGTKDSELKGLAIHIEDTAKEDGLKAATHLRQNFESLVISVRRKLIPYRLRAVVLYILTRLREHDTVDQIIGAGIIMMGALMWASFLFLENSQQFLRKRIRRDAAMARRH